MPNAEEILRGLAALSQRAMPLAVLWHAAIGAALIALYGGRWRPWRRTAALLLSLPLLSVSALAFWAGNPFNGAVFGAAAVSLGALGWRLGRDRVEAGPWWVTSLGAASLMFGWLYPHFLDARPSYFYLVAAPTGLIPCPTLAVVLGFALLGGGLSGRAWSLTLGALGLFYSLFGMFRLGVWLDAGLLASAVGLIVCALRVDS